MAAHKTFVSARAEQKLEDIVFDIGDGEEKETFRIARPLPGFIMLDFAAFTIDNDDDNFQAFTDFFSQAFNQDEYKRFRKVCSKQRVPLKANPDTDELEENELSLLSIVQYVIEEDTGRPTAQQSDSQASLVNTGQSSDTAA